MRSPGSYVPEPFVDAWVSPLKQPPLESPGMDLQDSGYHEVLNSSAPEPPTPSSVKGDVEACSEVLEGFQQKQEESIVSKALRLGLPAVILMILGVGLCLGLMLPFKLQGNINRKYEPMVCASVRKMPHVPQETKLKEEGGDSAQIKANHVLVYEYIEDPDFGSTTKGSNSVHGDDVDHIKGSDI